MLLSCRRFLPLLVSEIKCFCCDIKQHVCFPLSKFWDYRALIFREGNFCLLQVLWSLKQLQCWEKAVAVEAVVLILQAQHVMSPWWGCLYIVPLILSVFWTGHKRCIYSHGHMNDLKDDVVVRGLNWTLRLVMNEFWMYCLQIKLFLWKYTWKHREYDVFTSVAWIWIAVLIWDQELLGNHTGNCCSMPL